MKKIVLFVLFVILTWPGWAEEIFVIGGVTRDAETGTAALQRAATYRQGLGE